MATKRKNQRKRRGQAKGGTMMSMRGGIKGVVGQGSKRSRKESTLSKVLSYVLIAAALAFVVYYRLLR